jgi:hypothetical protein
MLWLWPCIFGILGSHVASLGVQKNVVFIGPNDDVPYWGEKEVIFIFDYHN